VDRARRARAQGPGPGATLRRVVVAALLAIGCAELLGDFSDIIALEYAGPAQPRVAVNDTIRLTARALDRNSQVVPDAPITWYIMEVDTVQVGFTLEQATGLVTGTAPGAWRVQARLEDLRTNLITVTVEP
jgi:hypothetical protein